MFGSFDISASGLTAQRTRFDAIVSNIANYNNNRAGVDAAGNPTPYRRLYTVFAAQRTASGQPGVRVANVAQDQSDFREVYEPWNPDHDAGGYVKYPNVDLATEQVDALEATRAYEANATAIETTKSMLAATLRIMA